MNAKLFCSKIMIVLKLQRLMEPCQQSSVLVLVLLQGEIKPRFYPLTYPNHANWVKARGLFPSFIYI